MKKIYSKVNPKLLILTLFKINDLKNDRINLSPDNEIIQASCQKLKKGFEVAPHKHINKVRNTNETQEAWIVLRGKIEGEFFDLDDKSIFKCELCFGDCIVVYRGGQRLKVLEDNTIFYEFKNGPYFGAHEDKIDIVI